jgi:hypothetical protein
MPYPSHPPLLRHSNYTPQTELMSLRISYVIYMYTKANKMICPKGTQKENRTTDTLSTMTLTSSYQGLLPPSLHRPLW